MEGPANANRSGDSPVSTLPHATFIPPARIGKMAPTVVAVPKLPAEQNRFVFLRAAAPTPSSVPQTVATPQLQRIRQEKASSTVHKSSVIYANN